MNKKDFSELHRLLAILKYDLIVDKLYMTNDKKEKSRIESMINAVDTVMKITVIDMEK